MLRLDPTKVIAREVDDELVVLDLSRQSYLSGNPSSAKLWPLLVEGTTEEALASQLVGAYDIDRSTAAADVSALIDDLRRRGLVAED